jgi:hypothetical protein
MATMADTGDVTKFLADYSPKVRDLALQLRALIKKVAPDAVEHVYTGWKTIRYALSERAEARVCYISPAQHLVRLGFDYANDLPDPQQLLQGTGARMRHIKIEVDETPDFDAYRRLLQVAFEQARQRKSSRASQQRPGSRGP